MNDTDSETDAWSNLLFDRLIAEGVELFAYIPDFGIARLIELAEAHNDARAVLLTSEEEGVAICAGADLVGRRAVLCMQSSGVGNCGNFLSLVKGGGFPILMIVSMRGDYGEENPWQYPMGQAVEPWLSAMGVLVFRVDAPEDLGAATSAALAACHKAGQGAALLLSQKFLGAKAF
jgi:sulfopyruvate decarboxylase alpha subunit